MPPRFVTAAIVLFWLATTGVLVYDEVSPRFQSGEAPPFTIPLTAEVGEHIVNWQVLQKDERVGSGTTRIKRLEGRTFELSADFTLDKLKILVVDMDRVKIVGKYVVTEDGKLLSSSAKVNLTQPLPAELIFEGEVREKMFHPRFAIMVGGKDINPFPLEPFPVSESGSVLNPMHLVHKISGLRGGQKWQLPLMDPLRAAPDAVKKMLPGNVAQATTLHQLTATVVPEDFAWRDAIVPCFRIEYAKTGERPLAATWVRRSDDAVLQQWASYEGIEYTLQRAPGQ